MAGLVAIVTCTVMLGAVLGLVLCQEELGRAVRRVRARLHPPPPAASTPAIEDLAAALRRLRRDVLATTPGTPMARRRGTVAAYDDLLAQAARALEVPDLLTDLREGTDREAERLRLEHQLQQAGLTLE